VFAAAGFKNVEEYGEDGQTEEAKARVTGNEMSQLPL
jgi:hypothetical protein